ncbi:MAG: cbb3-type cytochrome oxidase assembly protein CcoS [Bacteroidia bacterium]|nr:cbb3-type cytochrome oxidase assembly protein CcoS [Bacteroidia bacterium]
MEVIYILLSISILIAIAFLLAFVWSVKKGQYDDVVSPSIRILYDDQNSNKQNKITTENLSSINHNQQNQ